MVQCCNIIQLRHVLNIQEGSRIQYRLKTNKTKLTLIFSALVSLSSCTNGFRTAGRCRECCLGSARTLCGGIFFSDHSSVFMRQNLSVRAPLITQHRSATQYLTSRLTRQHTIHGRVVRFGQKTS